MSLEEQLSQPIRPVIVQLGQTETTILPEIDPVKFGVYSLTFPNGEIYIGSTVRNFQRRKSEHLWKLRKGMHFNPYLQRLYNKYGPPEFKILEECLNIDMIASQEQAWMDQFQGFQLINYGPAFPGPMSGKNHTKETCKKISEANRGKPLSLEHRHKISESHKGKSVSFETRQKLSVINKGKPNPKNSQIQQGKPLSFEHCQAISRALLGKSKPPMTKEHHQKLSEICRKNAQAQKGKPKLKTTEALKKYWAQKRLEGKALLQ